MSIAGIIGRAMVTETVTTTIEDTYASDSIRNAVSFSTPDSIHSRDTIVVPF